MPPGQPHVANGLHFGHAYFTYLLLKIINDKCVIFTYRYVARQTGYCRARAKISQKGAEKQRPLGTAPLFVHQWTRSQTHLGAGRKNKAKITLRLHIANPLSLGLHINTSEQKRGCFEGPLIIPGWQLMAKKNHMPLEPSA